MKLDVLSSALALAIAVALFGAGFLTGRAFPQHHFERWPDSRLLFDTSTGKVCSILAPQIIEITPSKTGNPFDSLLAVKADVPQCAH